MTEFAKEGVSAPERHIWEFPLSELLNDRAESLSDIRYCEKMAVGKLAAGYTERVEVNRKIVGAVEDELDRRGWCPHCGVEMLRAECKGNDAPCEEGPHGSFRFACPKWEPYCCKCGPRWAQGQQ